MADDADEIIAIWNDLLATRGRGGWWWLTQHAHHGDLYAICALAEAFRREHGSRRPLRLVIGEASTVPKLFAHAFDEVLLEPRFTVTKDLWIAFRARTGRSSFALDTPILVYFPTHNPDTVFAERFAYENAIPWTQIYKSVLHLPANAGPSLPPRLPGFAAEASAIAERCGMARSRSVILAPTARSWTANCRPHFEALARHHADRGLVCFTNCGPNETPLADTTALNAPLHLMRDLAEYAGAFAGLRSGICDIISSACCTKTIIFAPKHPARQWGLDRMGYCSDARQFAFDFAPDNVEAFVALAIGAPRLRGPSLASGDLLTINSGTDPEDGGVALHEGWWDLEDWGVWGRGSRHRLRLSGLQAEASHVVLELLLKPLRPGTVVTLAAGSAKATAKLAGSEPQPVCIELNPSKAPGAPIEVTIDVDEAISPHDLHGEASGDRRAIGIGLTAVRVVDDKPLDSTLSDANRQALSNLRGTHRPVTL